MDHDEYTCDIPLMIPMEKSYTEHEIDDPYQHVLSGILSKLKDTDLIKPGDRIAITVGSRGIGSIHEIVKGIVFAVKFRGAHPFIVPSMGSHGGTSPDEKTAILEQLGVSEHSVGAPISKEIEILAAGSHDDVPVFCQAEAYSADSIILVNRIKTHTDFHGEIESGLVKMSCVGLGGIKTAQWVHSSGYDNLANRILAAGTAAIQKLRVILGVAITEGITNRPTRIEVLRGEEIIDREKEMLQEVREHSLRIARGSFDLLVVLEMGKDISGLGLDPFVTGRYSSGKVTYDGMADIYRIVVLDLTPASKGNASGIGLCDVTTERLFKKIDLRSTYRNVIISRGSSAARIPMVMRTDREAICCGLLTCIAKNDPEMVLIKDTLHLQKFLASRAVVKKCEEAGAEIAGDPIRLSFDEKGCLIWPSHLKE